VAPALHSLIICGREDAVDILGTLLDSHVDLRKLILKYCYLGDDVTGLLTNIIAWYPDLEALSLEHCYPLTSTAYSLISHLKKLCELNLSNRQVNYVYVKLLETHVYAFRTSLEIQFIYMQVRKKFTACLRRAVNLHHV
jgi:hypothetical protein